MNFQVIPKYTKYNKTLEQVYAVYVEPGKYAPKTSLPQVYVDEPRRLPVPIIITTYKEKIPKTVHYKESTPKIKNVSIESVPKRKYYEHKETTPKTKYYDEKESAAIKKYYDYKETLTKPDNNKENKRLWSLTKTPWPQSRKKRNWLSKCSPKEVPIKRKNNLSSWYKERKALHLLSAEKRKNKKKLQEWEELKKNEEKRIRVIELEKARRAREAEVFTQLMEVQKEQTKMESVSREKKALEKYIAEQKKEFELEKKKIKKEKPPNIKKEKVVKEIVPINEYAIVEKKKKPKIFKPVTFKKKTKLGKIKYITKENVKRSHRDNISRRFVNCFYRLCCEFYCWLTFIVLIAVAFIYLI